MGQVWSSADFDGMTELGTDGGCGSPLAVTAQNFGSDGLPFTPDDMLARVNESPARSSLDISVDAKCSDSRDRVRGFFSFHSGGAHFVYGDGSVHFLEESMDPQIYVSLSTIAGGEPVTQ